MEYANTLCTSQNLIPSVICDGRHTCITYILRESKCCGKLEVVLNDFPVIHRMNKKNPKNDLKPDINGNVFIVIIFFCISLVGLFILVLLFYCRTDKTFLAIISIVESSKQ
jgi:hypothetical protein